MALEPVSVTALAARNTLLPIYNDEGDQLLHLGFDYLFADPPGDRLVDSSPREIPVTETIGGLHAGSIVSAVRWACGPSKW